MNRSQQGRAVRLYVSLAALGLLLLFLWPSFVAAVPLTAKHELQRSWRYASDVGSYSYRSTMVRTKHPTLSLENVGRTAKVERASAQGSVDNPDETIQLTLWSVGIEQDGVDIKLEEGQSYARRSGGDEWTAIDQPATDFAPGGDPLGFLLAAENIQQLPDSARPAAEDGLQSIVYSSGGAETGYRFDIDGVKYADHMRLQMQQSMREQGELPASITLGPIAQYVNMEATGEIWLDKSGLPVKQIITMKFAPERGAQHWTEQQIITGFSSWDTAIAAHHLYVLVPRLLEEPSLLISDPLSLLPNPQYALFSIDERDVQEAGMMLSLLLLSAALLTLIIAQRRSPRFYAVLSLTIIVAMVVTPLLNMGQVSAYYARQETRQAEQQQQIEEQEQLEELKNQQMGGNFNPHRNPLTAQDVDPNAIAMASNAPTHRITLPATVQSTLPTPARALNCTLAEGSDCDGDGLTDDVELYELGTDPEDVDTDDDNISDKTEVEGFTQNGTDWYLDPSNPDSNGDGTLDGVACPELVDVVQGVLGTPTGSTCLNTDSDDVPDVFDFDDDADGVPDFSDSSRLTVAGPYNDTTEAFNFNIDLNQNGEPIFVDFEIRPTTPDHLYYTRNVLDWPDNDTKGQWTKNTSTTLADLGEDVTDDGDMILNPLLEIEITYDANNPTAGLPVDAGFSASAATIPDYSDLTWIDTEELDQWSIALNEGSTSDKLLLWIPLNVVAERIGDTPVGWSGRMQYVPQLSQTVLGNDQRIRMIWMIQGVKDTCSPPEDADYETYCADSANWTSTIDIMQTYYEDFYLTGLTVREDHGAKLHVIAEPSTAGNANYEDYLWHLADQLQDTFVRGEQNSDGSRFDVDDIPTYAANWGLTGLDYTTSTLADHSEFAQLAEDNLSILNRVFSSASVGDRTTLMTAGEEVARVATLNDDATTIDNSSVSVDLTSVDKATGTVVRFSPFVYEGASVWTDDTLENYQNVLAVDLANVFSNSELDTLISPSGETISDYDLVQDGAISLAQGFYLAVYVGIGATVELNDVSSNSDTVPDSGLVLSGEPVTNIVQHMLQEAQAFYAENSVVAALAGASDSYAANALSAAFATSQLAFLEALGAARQGDVTTSLTLALQELGDYYKVSDIDTTKFTDYASLSQQIHISGATSISDSYGQGWSIAYYAAKVLYNLYYVKWGLSFALGTAATIAKSASIFTKLWNSAKFWAVVGFIFQVGVALIIFLTGDYDNQLEYNAAAVQFAFTVIVAFILALITLIPVVGFLIVAVIALIDALVALICAAVGVEPGSAVDTWVCNGITGAVIRALSLLFSDQLVTVDLDKDDRLQVSFFTPEIDPSSGTDGYVQGNKLDISARVTNTLSLNEPKVGENLIILTSFSNSRLREIMRESTFSYHLQANKIDHSDDLDLGDASRWSNNNDQMVFDVTGEGEFNNAGINKSTDLYLTESFNVAGLDCGGFIGASEATCNVYDVRDVAHSFIGGQFALDIFPKDLDGFYSLATVGNNGGYRLSWDGGFPTLADADGDGLRSKAQGGNDPDDSDPDFDDDGLNDFWELDNGFDPTLVDSDIDGLNDYWEAFYNTSPYLADTDNDGLIDGDEFFHSNARSALIDDTSTWSGGWLFTYDFNGDTALKTRVSASPIDADTDGDNVTDRLEFVYGYNPKVPQELNILSLIAATDSIVAPSASVAYTATVKNELNSRTARGLLEAEFPVDITQEVQTFVLAQLEETTLNGSVTAPDLSSTTEVSVTIRAGAILEDPMAEDTDANLVAQYQFNENEPDTQCTGGFNNCSGASYDFADSSGNDIDAVCEKDFNGSYGVDCPVANGAFLEFLGVYNSSNSANYWTPVARIEADNAFVLDSFTIEAWVKPDGSQSHRQHILNKYGDITIGINRNSLQPFVEIQHSDCSDGDYDGLFSIDETITEQIGSTINLNQGQWNQIVVTYDDNTDRLTVYINGESGGAITTTSCMSSGLNDRITLGAMDVAGFSSLGNLNWIPPAFSSDSSSLIYGYSNAESFAFVGGLDRLQFFDDVLSTTEIDDLYRNGNRVIDFTFDDPPGATTFTDTSGNELDGTCSTACPESGLPGLSNQAVYFDNSIIAVPATSDTLGLINTSYTVMAWLKGGDYSGSGRYSTLLGTVIGVVHDETTDDGYLALGNFASNQALVVDTPLDTEEWHHVAWRLEYDNTTPANSTRTIFVDGVQVAQDNGEADVLSFFTALPIGLLYKGWLDELLIVRNALSVDEIQSYMNEAPNLSLHLDEDLDTTSFLDESQNQNSATCSGDSCPAAGADGWMREAPVFDGGDLLTVAANSALNVTDFSINLWVKPTNEKNLEQYLIRKSNGSGYNSNYSLSIEPNSLKVGFDIQSSCANANSGFKSISSNGELLENQWNSITATYDNDENEMLLYINGALDSTLTSGASGICTSGQAVRIGENFEGNLDEIGVYGGTLSTLEVAAIYDYQSSWYDTVQQSPVIVDAESPLVTPQVFSDLTLAPTIIAASAIDGDSSLSNVASVDVTVTPPTGGSAYTESATGNGNGDWLYTFSPTVEGEYTILFSATDLVGNVGTASTVVNVDDTTPTVTLDSSLTSSILNVTEAADGGPDTISLSGSVSDGGNPASGVVSNTAAIDVQDYQGFSLDAFTTAETTNIESTTLDWSVEYPVVTPPYGVYTVLGTAEDVAGNVITQTVDTISVDNLGPTADVMLGTVVVSQTNATISGTVMDVPFPGNSRELHLHFEEDAAPFNDATLRQASATCDGTACPTSNASGQLGQAADFDGNDLLSLVNIIDPSDTSFTAMAWLYADGSGATQALLSQQDGTGTGRTWLGLTSAGNLYSEFGGTQLASSNALSTGSWVHVAVTFDGTDLTLYIDGLSDISNTPTIEASDGDMIIGADKSAGSYFDGRLDELAIYDRALSQDEIYDIANPLSGSISEAQIRLRHLNGTVWPNVEAEGLKIYVPLDDDAGTTDFDYNSYLSMEVACDDHAGSCPMLGIEGASLTGAFFDGSADIEIVDTDKLDLQEMSVSFWVKMDAADSSAIGEELMRKGDDSWQIFVRPGAGTVVFATTIQVNEFTQRPTALISNASITDDQWHHIVATYDGATKSIYIDGSLSGTEEIEGDLVANDDPIRLGGFGSSSISALIGSLDEVAIFGRTLGEDEIAALYTESPWNDVTLASSSSNFTTWSYDLPDTLEGPYDMDLRVADSLGNSNTLPNVWIGNIDLVAPRATLTINEITDGSYEAECYAEDLNITDDGWVCPNSGELVEGFQDADWVVDFFTILTRTVSYETELAAYQGDGTESMTACDLVDNCTTITTTPSVVDEITTILTPTEDSTVTTLDPIEISGFSRAPDGLASLEVTANGETIYSTTWTDGSTESDWSFDWTPSGGGVYVISATTTDTDGDTIATDEDLTITVELPNLTLTKSVIQPDVLDTGEQITYTIVLSNDGLTDATGILVTDTLPSGVSPVDANDANFSATVDLAVGESVTYTIPVIVTAGLGEQVVNTAYYSYGSESGSSSVTIEVCSTDVVVTNGNNSGDGSLRAVVEALCDGSTITFSEDLTIQLSRSIYIDRGMAIDGSGFDVAISRAGRLLEIASDSGPVTLEGMTFTASNASEGGTPIDVRGSSAVTISNSVVTGIEIFFGEIVATTGDLTIIDSTISNNASEETISVGTDGSLNLVNSSVYGNGSAFGEESTIILNEGGTVDVNFSTLIQNSGALENISGQMSVANSILGGNDSFDCSGTVIDGGYNLVGNSGGCATDSGTTTAFDATNLFTAVVDEPSNGDEVITLLDGSPALDVIPSSTNGCGTDVTTDQRGVPRPQNGSCDVGAYEQGLSLSSHVSESLAGYSYDAGATTHGALGELTIDFGFVNIGSESLENLILVITQADNSVVVNTDQGVGGVGATMIIPNPELPGDDGQFDPGEQLVVTFVVAVDSTPWSVNFEMYGSPGDISASGDNRWLGTFSLNSTMFDGELFPSPDGQSRTIFLPVILSTSFNNGISGGNQVSAQSIQGHSQQTPPPILVSEELTNQILLPVLVNR